MSLKLIKMVNSRDAYEEMVKDEPPIESEEIPEEA